MTQIHPYITLRRAIRAAGKQFRKANDNSESLFHPEHGFVYAYDMGVVEQALDNYEKELPTEFISVDNRTVMETKLLGAAQVIAETNSDIDLRDFARQVLAYLVIHEKQTIERPRTTPLFGLRGDPGEVDNIS